MHNGCFKSTLGDPNVQQSFSLSIDMKLVCFTLNKVKSYTYIFKGSMWLGYFVSSYDRHRKAKSELKK